ncbi:MAG: metallophosphoesterase family protein [Verrucomicrobiota bacterium]
MKTKFTRRRFAKVLLAGTAGLSVSSPLAWATSKNPFSFALLGDLHFDKLQHHDLEWLAKTKPDDLRQVREYSSLSKTIQPRLFETVRQTIADLNRSSAAPLAFTVQVGDLVEGLCSNENLALQQDMDALEMVRQAGLGVPFLFAKGNHDIAGPGANEAFKTAFHPFLNEQRKMVGGGEALTTACYVFEQGEALFCFFDAYDRDSLAWLEARLAQRTARHCFVIIHPPVVPYGARSTWHIFSSEREKAQRTRLLELLGKHNAFVLGGHIHKFNLLVRSTPGGGQFLQLALSSVVRSMEVSAANELSGTDEYNADQVKVEPDFSAATQRERRAVYRAEAPSIKHFEYADLPGYAVVTLEGPKVTARIYAGASRRLWRTLPLSDLLKA